MSRKKYETDEEYHKRRQEEYKKYYEKKIRHEEENGLELLGEKIRVSDFVKDKILRGKTQVLVMNGVIVQFRKKTDDGYWVNTDTKNHNGRITYLHREKLRLHLGLTEEQMKGYDVHHIDGNKDNNDISNLKLITKEEHREIHNKRNENSKRHVCRKCGRTYWSSVSKSVNICDRCDSSLAIGGSSMVTIKKICKYCGAEYETKGMNRNRSKFCSNKCKSAYRRASKVDDIEKVCAYCGKKFKTNKYSGAIYCSGHCAVKRHKSLK